MSGAAAVGDQALDTLATLSGGDLSSLDHLTFSAPWAARAFGVTLAAAEAGAFTLRDFQQALIRSIRGHESGGGCIDSDEVYYNCWIAALTELVSSRTAIDGARLAAAEEAVREALRLQTHDHDHPHDSHHGHDDGDDHDHEPPVPVPIRIERGG